MPILQLIFQLSCDMIELPNLRYIKELSGGDADFEKKLFDVIKTEFPQERKTYQENLENADYLKVAENVHKLKHKISILGLEKSYELARKFEEELRDGKTHSKELFNQVLDAISKFIEEN